jgi:hypothetical protein
VLCRQSRPSPVTKVAILKRLLPSGRASLAMRGLLHWFPLGWCRPIDGPTMISLVTAFPGESLLNFPGAETRLRSLRWGCG